DDQESLQVHVVRRPCLGGARAGLRQELPDRCHQVRRQGRDGRHRQRQGRQAEEAGLRPRHALRPGRGRRAAHDVRRAPGRQAVGVRAPRGPPRARDVLLRPVGAPQARLHLGLGLAAGHRDLLPADGPEEAAPGGRRRGRGRTARSGAGAGRRRQRRRRWRRRRQRCRGRGRRRGGPGQHAAAPATPARAAGGGAMSALRMGSGARTNGEGAAGPTLERYTLTDRIVHWWVALTFIALMVSGFALGYPRAYFLSGLFGGGQTMRFLHPWFGVAFTLGILWMLVSWARDMRMQAVDREWVRRLRTYTAEGHTGLDTGRYNAGQKGYY